MLAEMLGEQMKKTLLMRRRTEDICLALSKDRGLRCLSWFYQPVRPIFLILCVKVLVVKTIKVLIVDFRLCRIGVRQALLGAVDMDDESRT